MNGKLIAIKETLARPTAKEAKNPVYIRTAILDKRDSFLKKTGKTFRTSRIKRGNGIPRPTTEEAKILLYIKKAILEQKNSFLKEPSKGFHTSNILSGRFLLNTSFSFTNVAGIKKEFSGAWILNQWGKDPSVSGIVELLQELKIDVSGSILPKNIKQRISTIEEAKNPAYIKKAILDKSKSFLKEPEKDIHASNIHAKFFLHDTRFRFINSAGIKKEFTGAWILKQWGKEPNIAGIVALLKELGIVVIDDIMPIPTIEEAKNSLYIKKAILEQKEFYLKDPIKGFYTSNIHLVNFKQYIKFCFINTVGIEKVFKGKWLLEQWGKKINLQGVVVLLKELGIVVIDDIIPRPTRREAKNPRYIIKAILGQKKSFLKNPQKGFSTSNIHVLNFLQNTKFMFINLEGIKKEFAGRWLLEQWGKELTVSGIVALLKELGIVVIDYIAPIPTSGEAKNPAYIKQAILDKKDSFLKDPRKGFSTLNIQVINFNRYTKFSFINSAGIKKQFLGNWLLEKGGKESNLEGIAALLKELGVDVSGDIIPRAIAEEAKNPAYIKKAILEQKNLFLRDSAKGFCASNIYVEKFLFNTSFRFINSSGIKKKFFGNWILRHRGKKLNISGILALLKELGLEITKKQ